MNIQEAKLILGACRPRGHDAADPRVQEALALLNRDPELAVWHARESRINAALGGKVREQCRPPADLKASILAATRMARPVPWYQQPAWISTMAAVLVGALVLLALVIPKKGGEFARFQTEMAGVLNSKDFHLDLNTASASEVRQWLADRRVDFVLPAKLEAQPTHGCRVLDWQGHQVSLVCFELAGGETVHLFTVDRSALRDAPPKQLKFGTAGRYALAGWTRGEKVYLAASSKGEATLRKLL